MPEKSTTQPLNNQKMVKTKYNKLSVRKYLEKYVRDQKPWYNIHCREEYIQVTIPFNFINNLFYLSFRHFFVGLDLFINWVWWYGYLDIVLPTMDIIPWFLVPDIFFQIVSYGYFIVFSFHHLLILLELDCILFRFCLTSPFVL